MSAPLMLATDLDRTLLPNGPQPETPGVRGRFAAVAAHPEVTLAYVTGRHRELVEEAIAAYRLPRPHYVIGDVGTSLYRIDGAAWRRLAEWDAALDACWAGQRAAALAPLLASLPGLHPQEAAKQGDWKASWYAPPLADPAPLLAAAHARLAAAGVAANLVWSVDETVGVALLDLLPAAAGKLAALRFLLDRLGLPPHRALFAGDSGNDLEVLAGPLPAVLVANAGAAVRRQALALARRHGHPELLYCAHGRGGDNGNYAAGILEGLAHFLPETAAWIGPEER